METQLTQRDNELSQKPTTAVAAPTREVFFTPRTDVYETADALVIVADVPGADEQGINLTLEGEVLTVEAKVATVEQQGFSLSHREYDVGNYRRTFTVHTPIERDGITAALTDGVLRVTLPKAKEARVQRIQVKGS